MKLRRCLLALPLSLGALLYGAPARAQNLMSVSCVQGYAKAFGELNVAADKLRLKADTAPAEVAQIFKERPARCDVGGYEYYLNQLLGFTRRALRSGTSPLTPKDGWVRAAAAAAGFAPRLVPQAEYYDDMQRYQASRKELLQLVTEAGAGPLPSAILSAFERAAPQPGAFGPKSLPPGEAASAPPAYAPPTYAPPTYAPPTYAPPPTPVPTPLIIPSAPLPDWAIVSLHELRDELRRGHDAEARARLEQVLRWVESQR